MRIRSGGGGEPVDPMQRIAAPATGTLLFAGHSFVQTAWGGVTSDGQHGGILYSDWPGSTLSDFVPFGSSRAVWDLNGHARNSDYDLVLVSDVADLATGFPAPGPSMVNSLQALYWHGLAAAARGAELILFQPWSPQAVDLDGTGVAAFAYYRQWLTDHLGTPVWVIPTGQYVRALRREFGDDIFVDGLHLRAASQYARGVSYLTYSFLTKERCPFVREGDGDVDQIAWDTLQSERMAGFGGTAGVDAADIADPLPEPLPLPD